MHREIEAQESTTGPVDAASRGVVTQSCSFDCANNGRNPIGSCALEQIHNHIEWLHAIGLLKDVLRQVPFSIRRKFAPKFFRDINK